MLHAFILNTCLGLSISTWTTFGERILSAGVPWQLPSSLWPSPSTSSSSMALSLSMAALASMFMIIFLGPESETVKDLPKATIIMVLSFSSLQLLSFTRSTSFNNFMLRVVFTTDRPTVTLSLNCHFCGETEILLIHLAEPQSRPDVIIISIHVCQKLSV